MKGYLTYDITFRRIISIIFRLLLVINGTIILLTTENRLPIYIYLIAFVFYIIVFFLLYGKEGKLSKLRLLNDFIFIGVILFGKNLNSIINTVFLFLPIINSPNHSGVKRSRLVYLFTIIVILISDRNYFSYWYILPVVILWVLSWFESLRFNLSILTNNLMSIIDKYDVKNYQFGNTHKIYRELIEEISSSKLSGWFDIDKIICFIIKENDGLILYNSSKFISTYSIKLQSNLLKEIKNGKLIKNVEIKINDELNKINFFKAVKIVSKRKNNESLVENNYLFCITLKKNNSAIYELFKDFIISFLTPLLVRIARLIAMETELRLIRDNEILRIKNKLAYVNNALLAMHFIRNKLSPIQNAIKMTLNEQDLDNTVDVKQWEKLKLRDLKISETALLEIRDKTNYILESEDNPFKVKELYPISFGKIFFVVRRIWLNHFAAETIKVNINLDTLSNSFLNLNGEAIEIVFTDIITNAAKYCNNKDNAKLVFSESDGNVIIEFMNDIRQRINIADLTLLVDSFNTKEFSIITRKTHGLKIVKDFLEQMDVIYKMELNGTFLIFRLIFKKIVK